MANDFYNPSDDTKAKPLSPVRSAQFNDNNTQIQAGFGKLPNEEELKSDQYGVDSGTDGTRYVVETPYDIGYVIGMRVTFKAANENEAAAVISLNGGVNAAIRGATEEPVLAGSIKAGQVVTLVCTSASTFQLVSSSVTNELLEAAVSESEAAAAASASFATDSANSASAAATSATNAANSASASATSATNSANSASAAATSATNSANSATAAANSAAAASASASAAATSEANAASTLENALKKDQNLNDLPDKPVARTNLGLGDAATKTVQTSATDATAGRVMLNGAHGLGASVPRIDDANTPTVGSFVASNPAASNFITSFAAGIHAPRSESEAVQIMGGITSNVLGFRRKSSNVWQPWLELWHSGNLPKESGTWTPTVQAGGVSVAQATYERIGRQVTLNLVVSTFTDTTSATPIEFGGIPFVPQADFMGVVGFTDKIGNIENAFAQVQDNNSRIQLRYRRNGIASGNILHSDITASSGSLLYLTVTYFTN